MIIHLVLFKLKEESLSRKDEVVSALRALGTKIPELVEIEAGCDFNRSPAAYDIGLYTTFKTKDDLAIYQSHPEHLKVVELINETTEARVVTDYEI